MNLGFVILGALAALAGIVVLVAGIRGGAGENPRATAKLIGGMMLTAFGLVLGGFAIGYSATEPLNYAEGGQ